MKPIEFKPEGRKIDEFPWQSEARVRDGATRTDLGPTATVVVRYVEKDATFNGRVEGTTVYAEGDGVKGVRDECFAQLDSLHAVVWTERLWVLFRPDDLYGGRSAGAEAFRAVRVRTAVTPHGTVWQRWGKLDRHSPAGPDRWLSTRLGEPPVGRDLSLAHVGDNVHAILCAPSADVQAAVAELSRRWAGTLARACTLFELTFAGANGIDELLRHRGELVPLTLAEAAERVEVTTPGAAKG